MERCHIAFGVWCETGKRDGERKYVQLRIRTQCSGSNVDQPPSQTICCSLPAGIYEVMMSAEDILQKWKAIDGLAGAIGSSFPADAFLTLLLAGILDIAQRAENPIRGNLCAAGLRELVGHILHSLAPDERVTACSWYVSVPNTVGPTRAQRVAFIVHAGLTDDFVQDELEIDLRDTVRPLTSTMAALNKATHVRPHSVLYEEAEIQRLLAAAFGGVLRLLDAANDCRIAVNNALEMHVDEALFSKLIDETIQDLDELSTHTSVEGHQIDEIRLEALNDQEVVFVVQGQVHVRLQYGSGSDLRRGDGVVQPASYPYAAELRASAADPTNFCAPSVRVKVDNSSFYQ